MTAKLPTILNALKALLSSGISSVTNCVYLPWDTVPDDKQLLLQIAVDDASIDDSESMGSWQHTLPVQIGAVHYGKFDYSATWEVLNSVTDLLRATTLANTVQRIDITGSGDSITVAGDKILWPHVSANIVYLTPAGAL